MAFWSSQTLRARIPAEQIIEPYAEGRVIHSAYEMGVGGEAFVTSNPSDKTLVSAGTKIVIPPGQFGLIVTRETVHVPTYAIAFISIRAGIKFQGLVNVSGFHVDPGYRGQLKFAVYNAGSSTIVLDQDQRVFMIWFADLDHPDDNPYPERMPPATVITAEDVRRIAGDVASPAHLKEQFDKLKTDFDKRLHELETESEKRLHKLETESEQRLHKLESNTDKRIHTIETRQLVVQTLLGAVLVGLLMTIGGAVVKYLYERSLDNPAPAAPAPTEPAPPTAKPAPAPAIPKAAN